MDKYTFDQMLDDYEANYTTLHRMDKTDVLALIDFGIRNGYLKEIEKRNAYTFGGVTVALTDVQLSTLMKYCNTGINHAIKLLQHDYSTNLSLKQAYNFMDHLRAIVRRIHH